jgi:hypothetical protein
MTVLAVGEVDGLTTAAASFNGLGPATGQAADAEDARRRLPQDGGTEAALILPAR